MNLEETWQEYEQQWQFIDELEDKEELPNKDWIALDKMASLHVELRPIVDEFMRLEHDLLRRALFKDQQKNQKKKRKKPKYKPQAPKKQKKPKNPKKTKKINNGESINVFAAQPFDECFVELENMKVNGFLDTNLIYDLLLDFLN